MPSETIATEPVLEALDGAIWRLTIDRADVRNALTVDVARALKQRFEAPPAAARAIILTGAGSTFCAGGDLNYLINVVKDGAEAASKVIYAEFQSLVRAMLGSRLPIIAAVNGPAIGAGLDLALACDLRVASATATFASAWIKLGLVTGMGGSWLLTRALGGARASEMLLLGEAISAEKALSIGLVRGVSESVETLQTSADALAKKLCALSPKAIEETRASIRRALDHQFDEELGRLSRVQGQLLTSPEFEKAAERFLRPKS